MNHVDTVSRRHLRAIATRSGAAVLALILGSEPRAADVDYVVQQASCAEKPCLHVTLSFVSAPDGITRLRLPGDYAGSSGAASALKVLQATSPDTSLTPIIDGEVKVRAKAGERVTVRYELHRVGTLDAGATLSGAYLPLIERERARVLGWTALAIPMLPSRAAQTASMSFLSATGSPLSAYTNLGATGTRVEFAWHPMTIGTSIVLLGDYAKHSPGKRTVADSPMSPTLIVAGNAPPGRDFKALADDLVAVHRAIAGYWGDAGTGAPLVYFGEIRDAASSLKGSAFGSAFLTFATPDRPRDDLLYLWMHELNHAWLPGKMLRQYGRRGPDLYWFSEGFTEFVTHWLLEDSGIKPAGHLLRELTKAQQRLAVIAAPERYAILLQRFHRDAAANRQIYDRGFLLAARWDQQITCQSGGTRSLRDALRSLLTGDADSRAALDVQTIEPMLTKAGVVSFARDIDRYADHGEAPIVSEILTSQCRS